MPVLNFTFSVGTAATQICWPTGGKNKYVYVQNGDYAGDSEVYVGGAAVTTEDGHRVWRDGNAVYEIDGDDELYAISTAGTGVVRVIEVR